MNLWEQKFKQDNILISFKEDFDAMLYSYKDGDNLFLIIKIIVKENNKVISQYSKTFEKETTFVKYNKFIKNFLENISFRSEYLIEGFNNWDGIINFTLEDGVNKKCKEIIYRLNKTSNKKLKFKDFATLKTFGRDKYSNISYNDLVKMVSKETLDILINEFNQEKYIETSLRWILRGLNTDLSIRKVKTDIEITNNKLERR